MRFSLGLQIKIKNIKITHQWELRFLRIYIMENLTWDAHARSLRIKLCKENIKEINELLHDKKHLLFEFFSYLRYGILWGGDGESNNIFKLQKKAL
jgi:hypothetical protein